MRAAHSNEFRSGPAVASSENNFFCPGHGGEGGGRGATCRPAHTRADFFLLFTTEISLEISTSPGKVTEYEDIHHRRKTQHSG